MAVTANKIHLSGLARKLVVDGLLDDAAAQDHYQKAMKEKKPFVSYLVENKIVASRDIGMAAAQEFGIPLLDISALELDMETIKLVKEKVGKLRDLSPLWDMHKEGIDLSTVQWAAH